MLTAEKSTDPNPARALYENFMTGEYGKKWDDLPAGVQKRWADALAAGVVAMTSVRIEPVADFDMEAFRSSALENGKIAVLPTQTDLVFSDGEPYAAMTVDYLGCEYLSRDVEGIEKIAAAGSKGPTEVVYLFRGTKSVDRPLEVAASEGANAIAIERRRQIEKEGWTPEHDDQYVNGELLEASACYALHEGNAGSGDPPPAWPWDKEWWKPADRRRDLEKAGALIAAELDRVIRAAAPTTQEYGE